MDAPNVFLTASLDGSIKWWEAEFDPDAKGMSKARAVLFCIVIYC